MSPKKKKQEFTEAEEALLTEEEMKAFEEEEKTPEEGKEHEPEGSETKPKEEEKPKEPPEKKPGEGEEGKKPEAEGEEEAGKPKEPIEEEKVTIVVDGEKIEGAIAKGGQYIIPYSEVQKRDERYGRVKTENEALKTQIEALKAKPPEPEKKSEEKPPEIDLDALEAKLYETEDVKAFLKDFVEQIRGAPKPSEEKPEEKPEVKPETPEQIASRVEKSLALKQGVKEILKKYPILDAEHKEHDPNREFIFTQLGVRILGEKIKDMTPEEQIVWTSNVENLLAATSEAAEQTMTLVSGGTGDFDPEKEREKIRAEEQGKTLEWVKTKLNLKEEDVRTLGDVASRSTDASQKAELDAKDGLELEEAMANMTEEDRRKYVDSET